MWSAGDMYFTGHFHFYGESWLSLPPKSKTNNQPFNNERFLPPSGGKNEQTSNQTTKSTAITMNAITEASEETNPLLSSTAISTPPYAHRDAILRSTFLSEKHRENQQRQRHAREISSHNDIVLFCWDTISAIVVFATHLVTLQSIVGCLLTVGATLIAYYLVPKNGQYEWDGHLPSVLLSFACS